MNLLRWFQRRKIIKNISLRNWKLFFKTLLWCFKFWIVPVNTFFTKYCAMLQKLNTECRYRPCGLGSRQHIYRMLRCPIIRPKHNELPSHRNDHAFQTAKIGHRLDKILLKRCVRNIWYDPVPNVCLTYFIGSLNYSETSFRFSFKDNLTYRSHYCTYGTLDTNAPN